LLKKSAQMVLITSLDKAIWNWMETYPAEFEELQQTPNEELSKNCEMLFDSLDGFADNKKSRAAVWPLQIVLLILSPVREIKF
jgi:neurofibromin 1